ncbi:hypothetical protein KY289_026643 [Solanum tuberosum]|nr:hypothetical protein KY289_026643 [Solanum tuberosum]
MASLQRKAEERPFFLSHSASSPSLFSLFSSPTEEQQCENQQVLAASAPFSVDSSFEPATNRLHRWKTSCSEDQQPVRASSSDGETESNSSAASAPLFSGETRGFQQQQESFFDKSSKVSTSFLFSANFEVPVG